MTWPQGPGDPYGQQPGGYDPYGQQPGGYDPNAGQQPYSAQPYSGQPGYDPYGQQAGYQAGPPYGGYPQPRGTNTMAILALVFGFVVPPLGIVFGHMAKKQIRQSGEDGDGLATAGLVIGYIHTGLWFIVCCIYGIALVGIFGSAASSSSSYNSVILQSLAAALGV